MPITARGRRTDAAFLEAARRVFAEKGYFNSKIADIAEAAGRSPGSFYNYFVNKEELLERLAEQFIDEVLAQALDVPHQGDPYENIVGVVTVYWNTYRSYVPALIGMFHLSMTDQRFAARWNQLRERGANNVLRGIRRAQRQGYASGINERALASAIMSMIESFCWTWLAGDGDPELGPIDDRTAVETLAAVWYRALYFPAPTRRTSAKSRPVAKS